MITPKAEYKNMIDHRLEENWKSFNILLGLKHYGNCISIICQELDQYVRILFLLKQNAIEQENLINNSINNQKWHKIGSDGKKEYITDESISSFARELSGWESEIYRFGIVFENISSNFNYVVKDPIKGLDDQERKIVYDYVKDHHDSNFPKSYTIEDLMPVFPMIFMKISNSIREYSKLF